MSLEEYANYEQEAKFLIGQFDAVTIMNLISKLHSWVSYAEEVQELLHTDGLSDDEHSCLHTTLKHVAKFK